MKADGLKLFLFFFVFFSCRRVYCDSYVMHINSLITHLQLKKMSVDTSLRHILNHFPITGNEVYATPNQNNFECLCKVHFSIYF